MHPPKVQPERADWYREGMEYSVYNRNLAPSNDDVDWLHVFQKKEHIHRLPPELRQKSSSFLSKRCKGRLPDTLGQARANPRKAVPQFYMPKGGKLGHLQLLLPIRMGDDETQPPDCALVMRLTNHNNYSIITILDKNQVYRHPFPLPPKRSLVPCASLPVVGLTAHQLPSPLSTSYWNARLIQRIDQDWLYTSGVPTLASAPRACPNCGYGAAPTHPGSLYVTTNNYPHYQYHNVRSCNVG